MNHFRHTSRGSALLISLVVLVLLTIVTTVFLERIWSSSQTVNGLEASNAAYYQAIGLIEEQLNKSNVTKKTPWEVANFTESLTATGRKLVASTGGTVMPIAGKGNSPYDPDYNIIALGQPVQIVLPDNIDFNKVAIEFRIPKIDQDAGTGVSSAQANSGIILWTLGSSGASLYASGETNIFRKVDINSSIAGKIGSFNGLTNSGSNESFNEFYTKPNYLGPSGNKCANYQCTLKFSMIRNIQTKDIHGIDDNRSLPFLEYRIDFGSSGPIPPIVPSQYMTLEATAWAHGFQRSRTIRIPQITTNTALDFAVLQ